MSKSVLTLEEITESLTGFDEIAIEKVTGHDLTAMQDTPVRMVRALVAIDLNRKADTGIARYAEDYKQAMGMTMREVMDYFATDEEVLVDEPETDSGKGEPPSA